MTPITQRNQQILLMRKEGMSQTEVATKFSWANQNIPDRETGC
jgi:transcriptional regulator